MQRIIVVENPELWPFQNEGLFVLKATDYIQSAEWDKPQKLKVINLCRSYQYQSTGYYISLLAEARGHRVVPDTSSMIDLSWPALVRDDAQDFDEIIQECLQKYGKGDRACFNIYFGITENPSMERIGQLLFNLFQVPVQKAVFVKKEKWQIQSLKPVYPKDLKDEEKVLWNAYLKAADKIHPGTPFYICLHYCIQILNS